MSVLKIIAEEWRKAGQPQRKPVEPRDLTEQDYSDWSDALDQRASMNPRTINSVRAQIRGRNPIRWAQLQRDLKWVGKEMKKMGLNPDDARYLL